MVLIKGNTVDRYTRCIHYSSELDIVAIQFPCCREFYPCYKCHEEQCKQDPLQWKKEEFDQKAIYCGNCQSLLSIKEYMQASGCPSCDHPFNPNCSFHFSYYFQV